MKEKRILQINELIKRELGKIINKELDIESGTLVTITNVDTGTDLSETKVYLSIFPENQTGRILNRIKKIRSYLQKLLTHRLVLHHVPKIRFLSDENDDEFWG